MGLLGYGHSVAAVEISGTVYNLYGAPFAEAPIQLVSDESGAEQQTKTAADGSYAIGDLAAGSYTLSIAMPCCLMATFTEENLQIGTGGLRFDVHMKQGDSLETFGDDPAELADYIRSRQEIPDLPVPHRDDGKPDLSGVWLVGHDPFPVEQQLTDWAAEIGAERLANVLRHSPHTRCLPEGLPIPAGTAPFMGKFVQTDDLLVILFEDVPGFRQIFLDGREHAEDPNPTWLGHSVGHWDGDALIVDTIGFNDRVWLGPLPISEAMHMVERYRRTEYGVLELQVTYEDPAVFKVPWVEHRQLDLVPQEELMEYVCENNKWATDAAARASG